jgi:CRP-like cAMP-binding protein
VDDKERLELFEYMGEVKFSAGDVVIRQGFFFFFPPFFFFFPFFLDDPVANDMFVVSSGELDVFKDYHDGKGNQKVFHYGASGVFGELALMYNTPRAASVIAVSDVVLWSIDRVTFSTLLEKKTRERRKLYSEFLSIVPLLQNLDKYEQLKIADSLSTEVFNDGEVIIKEGDEAEKFYLILEGQVKVSKGGVGKRNFCSNNFLKKLIFPPSPRNSQFSARFVAVFWRAGSAE